MGKAFKIGRNMILHDPDRAVNPARLTSLTAQCDTCTRPVGIVAPYTIDTTTRNICRFCRHSLRHGRFCNILRLIERFFDGMVTS